MDAPTLLFVDDEPELVEIAKLCFQASGWKVFGASGATAARAVLQEQAVDAILSDIIMRGGSGLELLDWVRQEFGRGFIFFLLTGCLDDKASQAYAKGADGVFHKPCDWSEVVQTLGDTVETRRRIQSSAKGLVAYE